jgi:hypothetical protein
MENFLRYLVKNELYVICGLLRADDFISYCKQRDLAVSRERLEQLEKLGVLYPVARVRRPKIKIKLERGENGTRYLGVLEEGEEWHGETKEKYAHFSFKREHAETWFNEGLLWEPSSRLFEAWKNYRDENGEDYTESYYSIFQCYPLCWITSSTTIPLGLEFFVSPSEEEIKNFVHDISGVATKEIESLQGCRPESERVVSLCQVISNRYFPRTQSDRRQTFVSISGEHYRWSWHEYSRTWNAQKVLEDLRVSIEEVKNWQEFLSTRASACDPLANWYDLVSFISVEQKKRLKGKPLLAQSLYAMEEMLRLFYLELTGIELFPPDESPMWKKDDFLGEGVTKNELRHLEFLTNRYHLNPRPKLILVVEGTGEENELPRLAKNFGLPLPRVGIEVINLKGIDKFVGRKRRDKNGALEKFIDYYHSQQTIVFVILDNESRAGTVKNELVTAPSQFYEYRTVTKAEYIRFWKRTIEFDNFSHDEIAEAMTEVCERRCRFTAEEIRSCKEKFDRKKGDYLSELFSQKLGGNYELPKPRLLQALFEFIIRGRDSEFDANGEPKRPVVRLIPTFRSASSQFE